MRRQNRYYTHGTSAYKFNDYSEKVLSRRQEAQKRRARLVKSKEKVVQYHGYIEMKREKSGHSKRVYSSLFMIFIICFLLVESAFKKLDYERQKADLNSQLAEIQNENKHLEEKIKQGISDEELNQIAVNTLKMNQPTSYQKRYIVREKQNYVVQYDINNTQSEHHETGFKGLAEWIINIFKE